MNGIKAETEKDFGYPKSLRFILYLASLRLCVRIRFLQLSPASPSSLYPEDTVNRVLFIKRAQELGFSLKEVAELLSLRVGPESTCGEIRKVAEGKIADIEGKIHALQRMKEALAKLAAACSGRGPTSECPILEALENEEDVDAEG